MGDNSNAPIEPSRIIYFRNNNSEINAIISKIIYSTKYVCTGRSDEPTQTSRCGIKKTRLLYN